MEAGFFLSPVLNTVHPTAAFQPPGNTRTRFEAHQTLDTIYHMLVILSFFFLNKGSINVVGVFIKFRRIILLNWRIQRNDFTIQAA